MLFLHPNQKTTVSFWRFETLLTICKPNAVCQTTYLISFIRQINVLPAKNNRCLFSGLNFEIGNTV